jgi:hypothetical protein
VKIGVGKKQKMGKNYLKNNRRKLFWLFFCLTAICVCLFFFHIQTSSAADATAQTKPASSADACTDQWLNYPIQCFLLAIARFVQYLLSSAQSLFAQMVDVNNFQYTVNNSVIYQIWQQVRDMLNIAFILVLLFSAFATIFQVEKYSYKKILLRLVIMALLVNFSFPISRFIIDISNSLMYTLITVLFQGDPRGGAGVFAGIAGKAGLAGDLGPATTQVSGLLATIAFTFILAVSLLAVGVLFVIRIVALAILIIFSPIAFVGAILPDTGGIASKWWNYLFKYAFFGPIMIFMIYIASHLMALAPQQKAAWDVAAMANSTNPPLVGAIAFFSIPIVLLWMGMKVATSMSIAGAGTVINFAQKAGKAAALAPVRAGWWVTKKGAVATGVPGGVKQIWNKRVTQPLDRSRQNKEAAIASFGGDKSAAERNMKTRAAEYEKNNESIDDLKKWASKGDAAAAYTLANRGKIDQKTFTESMKNIKDKKTKESLISKAEDTRMDVTLKYKLEMDKQKLATDSTKKGWTKMEEVAKHEYGNLNAEAWSKQKNLAEQFTRNDNNPDGEKIKEGAIEAFKTLANEAKLEALKRMNGSNANAIKPKEKP